MPKREAPEINAGSMADIAFLLLIFFLVTTTMDSSYGVERLLPPIEEEQPDDNQKVNERNILSVLVNGSDQILANGKLVELADLKEQTKEFILNEDNRDDLPEFRKIFKKESDDLVNSLKGQVKSEKDEEKLKSLKNRLRKAEAKQLACELYGGDVKVSKGIISMQNVDQTSYGTYLAVQDEMASAYYEIRNAFAMEKLGKPFLRCTPEEIKAIKKIYPKAISEAEPINTGN
jgi:biopolymer transport protein ExbD